MLIDRQTAIDAVSSIGHIAKLIDGDAVIRMSAVNYVLGNLPSAEPTLYGFPYQHLELIAIILQKENLPPERVAECLTDIARIIEIVKDEFEEALRNALEQ